MASDTATGKIPTLSFNINKQVTGHTGCNSFSGTFVINGDSLSFVHMRKLREDVRNRAIDIANKLIEEGMDEELATTTAMKERKPGQIIVIILPK